MGRQPRGVRFSGLSTARCTPIRRGAAQLRVVRAAVWAGSRCALRRVQPGRSSGVQPGSQADDTVGVSDEAGDIGGRYPGPTNRREIVFGDPTGHGATLSSEDRYLFVAGLGDQFADRRDADAFELIANLCLQNF